MSEEHIETVEEHIIYAPHKISTDLAIDTNTSVGRDPRATQDVMSYASQLPSEKTSCDPRVTMGPSKVPLPLVRPVEEPSASEARLPQSEDFVGVTPPSTRHLPVKSTESKRRPDLDRDAQGFSQPVKTRESTFFLIFKTRGAAQLSMQLILNILQTYKLHAFMFI